MIHARSFWSIPSKHFLFSKTFLRFLEDVFSVTRRLPRHRKDTFQEVFKTSAGRVCKTSSSKRLQEDVLQARFEDVLDDEQMLR